MKIKKVLLTIILALVAIMLLQLQVNAGNVSEYLDSEYDYFLTESNRILSKTELSDEANAEEYIVACIEGRVDDSADQIFMLLERDSLDESGKISDYVAQRICEFIPYVSGYGLDMSVPDDTIIPASIFAKLKTCSNTFLSMWDNSSYNIITFYSSDIENTNVDFKIGVEISENPIGNMTTLEREELVSYIKFKNTGATPGKVEVSRSMGEGFEGEPDEFCYLTIEVFDENTKSYKIFDQIEDPYKTSSILGKGAVLYPQGGYATYNQTVGVGGVPEDWYVETEVDSLEWTEEDINKVLADIEETRNNTTDKQLYVHVPSGSKVPAKIFEASNGINITIISEDGIYASFSGGIYKAIDYVAGGTISDKAIDGMVNVGENNIVYLSLKHEGQLPSSCVISYIGGGTLIGAYGPAMEDIVETKVYYFNKEVQKYELCGSGEMDLVAGCYYLEIDHCSSYVMSEEELPDEFVIKATTGEDAKKEEPKKEETKKEDATKAPGNLPYTGGTTVVVISMLAVVAIGIITYKKNKDLRGI